tara:strand:- start:207 stop:455 length:249 start_codon:yes stop_codon:yes gene_type:complete
MWVYDFEYGYMVASLFVEEKLSCEICKEDGQYVSYCHSPFSKYPDNYIHPYVIYGNDLEILKLKSMIISKKLGWGIKSFFKF